MSIRSAGPWETIEVLEKRMNARQRRADSWRVVASKIAEKIEELRKDFDLANEKAHDYSEEAAGLRGILSIMRRDGYKAMRANKDGMCEFKREGE